MLGPAQFDLPVLIKENVVASPQGLKVRAEAMAKRFATEREMMRQTLEPIAGNVAIDRCVHFGPFERDVKILLDAGFRPVAIAVVSHEKFGSIQPHYGSLPAEGPVELASTFGFRLSRELLSMSVDGQDVAPAAGFNVTTFSTDAGHGCELQFDWAAIHERVVQAHAKHPDETMYEVRIDADVPMQTVVSLIDTLSYVDGSKMLLPDPVILLSPGK